MFASRWNTASTRRVRVLSSERDSYSRRPQAYRWSGREPQLKAPGAEAANQHPRVVRAAQTTG